MNPPDSPNDFDSIPWPDLISLGGGQIFVPGVDRVSFTYQEAEHVPGLYWVTARCPIGMRAAVSICDVMEPGQAGRAGFLRKLAQKCERAADAAAKAIHPPIEIPDLSCPCPE